MDDATIGLVGGIGGAALGLVGGLIGTAACVLSAKGRRARALAVRLSVLTWAGLAASLLIAFRLPGPFRACGSLLCLPMLLLIPRFNRALAAAEAEGAGGRTIDAGVRR